MTSREVMLEGGSPWGFRMHGGIDVHQPLRISRVNPGSKASLKGIREGDLITSINGLPTKEITNSEAHTLLKSAGDRLILGLNEDCQNSPKRRQYKTILHHHHQEVVQETSKTSTSTSHTTLITTNENGSQHGTSPFKTSSSCESNFEERSDQHPTYKLEEHQENGSEGKEHRKELPSRNPFADALKQSNGALPIDNNHEKQSQQRGQPASQPAPTNCTRKSNDCDASAHHPNESDYEHQVDETPCVSTVSSTPTPNATPTLTPTSSNYSSDTKGSGTCVAAAFDEEDFTEDTMPNKRHRKRRAKRSAAKLPEKSNKIDASDDDADIEDGGIKEEEEDGSLKDTPGCDQKQSVSQRSDNLKILKERLQYETFNVQKSKYTVQEIPTRPSFADVPSITNKRIKRVEIQEVISSLASSRSNSGDNLDMGSSYRVESPKTVRKVKETKQQDESKIVKSKSLDDILDNTKTSESLKITEVKSGDELSDDEIKLTCNEAVISEADSDVDWETTEELQPSNLNLSAQEEAQLKYFIEKLNLPGTSGVRVDEVLIRGDPGQTCERSSTAIRQKRTERKQQLKEYFAPVYQNPRFLEAISEESTDLSDKESKNSVVPVIKIVERGEAEVVVLDSSSGDESVANSEETESEAKLEEDLSQDETQKTPPPSPAEKATEDKFQSEDAKRSDSESVHTNEDKDVHGDDETKSKDARKSDADLGDTNEDVEIIKDITIKEEVSESTKVEHKFEIKVKKIYEEPSEEIESEIAEVQEKILQTEKKIEHDQKLIDDLQSSLEQDQKDIQVAQEEIQHLKSFEKEFKDVLQEKKRMSESPKKKSSDRDRSTSRSSDSSNSSVGTTVLYNPSVKDMTAIAAEAEAVALEVSKLERGEIRNPESLKECCLKLLVKMPFGKDALEELAAVSNSLKEFTESLPKIAYCMINSKSSTNNTTSMVTERKVESTENTETKEVKREGHEVITSSSKSERSKTTEERITDQVSFKEDTVVDISASKKLLDIIIKEKLGGDSQKTPSEATQQDTTKNNPIINMELLQELQEARLNAKDMCEWLHLARTTHTLPTVAKRHPQPAQTTHAANNCTPPQRPPRRRSLPPEIHVKQMQYLIEKEKQIQLELEQLESEKRTLINQMLNEQQKRDQQRPKSLPPHEELRQRMYEEYQRQLAEREERKHQKVIKISLNGDDHMTPASKPKDFNEIQQEFMKIVKEKQRLHQRHGVNGEVDQSRESSTEKSDVDGEKVLVLDGDELRAKKVPKHLKEFFTLEHQDTISEKVSTLEVEDNEESVQNGDGIWSPGQKSSLDREELKRESTQLTSQESLRSDDGSKPIVWTPKSAGSSPIADRKEFRAVNFESPILGRKNRTKSDGSANAEPPWKSDVNTKVEEGNKLPSSQSAPGPGFSSEFSQRLPKAQNPTITLLQKAREGQIPPKSAAYLEQERSRRKNESPYNSQSELIYNLRTESISDSDSERPRRIHRQVKQYEGIGPTTTHGMPVGLRSEIRDVNMSQWYKKMYDTIHKHRPSKYDDEEYVTIRYKQKNKGRYPFATGYLSEPEAGAYDSDAALSDSKYATLDRRRTPFYGGSNSNVASYPQQEDSVSNRYTTYSSSTLPNSRPVKTTKAASVSTLIPFSPTETSSPRLTTSVTNKRREDTTTITYKPEVPQSSSSLNKPGKIENYTPGKSSISDTEAKKWLDEVMDIFDGWLDEHSAINHSSHPTNSRSFNLLDRVFRRRTMEKQQQQRPKVPLVQPKGYLSQALKESGYESDSTLIFRRRDETAQQLSPMEQREVYKNIQRGGDVPLHGLRKVVPERPKEDDDVDIEYIQMTPTLNRLRVHRTASSERNSSSSRSPSRSRSRSSSSTKTSRQQIICYPIMIKHDKDTFANYKRSAPSLLYADHISAKDKPKERVECIIRTKPPSPPRRKSSRNNSTLRMIHNVKTPKVSKSSSGLKRHETCFSPTPKPSPNTNVKVLRDKIATKLTTTPGSKISPKITSVRKTEPKPVQVKCYCTRNRSCGKCTNSPQRQQLKSHGDVKKAVISQINSMNGKSSKAILENINGKRTISKIVDNSKTASSIKQQKGSKSSFSSSVTSSRSTLKSTSMDSLRMMHTSKSKLVVPKQGSKTGNYKDEVALKKMKKTKSKKELLNTQTKSENHTESDQKVSQPKVVEEKAAYVPKLEELKRNQPEGFFQQLFFGPTDTPDECKVKYSRISLENTRRRCDPTLGALKLYLGHMKPVSESRFKYLDMIRSRSTSPKTFEPWRYDRHQERSISLPPKLIFTQTSRPATPTFERRKLTIFKEPQHLDRQSRTEKIILTQTSRPVSPVVTRRERPRTPCSITSHSSFASSPCPSPNDMLYFSETSRPVSPVVVQQPPPRPRRPISPVYQPPRSPKVVRSPSYRKIKQKRPRASSADVETRKSMRFQELNKFYQDLERLGQLERTASSGDLRPKMAFEADIIDYDRWQEVRQRERAERELCSLYRQLNQSQKENDFLFRPKRIECYKWKRDLDRGLRIKERSVENLREEFEKIRKDQLEQERKLKEELKIKRGVYKSLWRGNSVVNLAQTLNAGPRSKSESRVGTVNQKIVDSEGLLTHGIGSRIWSSLSLEQVNILKNQLTEIYGTDKRFLKSNPPKLSLPSRHENDIEVSLEKNKAPRELRVRRNSDTIDPQLQVKGHSIGKSKSASDVKSKMMSEDEKRKLSHNLSKEILNLQLKKKTSNVINAKETRGAIAAADAQISETTSPRTCYSLEVSEDDQRNQDFLLVLTKNDTKAHKDTVNETLEIWARPKPCEPQIKTDCVNSPKLEKSETESGSTDGSTKTVIYNGNDSHLQQKSQNDISRDVDLKAQKVKKDKIMAKVEYFENKDKEIYTPTIYKPSDEHVDDIGDTQVFKGLQRSQSSQDLREFYGESNLKRIATEPLSASRKIKYTRPPSPVLRSDKIRCRSLSPDQTYNSLTVHDLRDKFENFYNQKFHLRPRRCASDPQLNKCYHEGEKVTELRLKFEYPKIAGRGRSRVRKSGLISSSHLKAEDRYMPHINIISKIATLYPKTHRKETSRSSENLAKILGIPVGEVHKLRERFDAADRQMSILGHMFTSSPNINELRDVAQYLTGSWYAHKYPKAADSDVVPRVQRPKSASPIRSRSKLASILKLPNRNRPMAAMRNEKMSFSPFRSWWSPSAAKHSVHFKEPEGPPPPPPCLELERPVDDVVQAQNANGSSSESPRKYVENEVTIHYRTPVRHEIKEIVDEQELARRQADAMRKIYEEERQRKHLQVSHSDNELQDRRSRRHTDNFIPSQKSPIPLNRYDDFLEEITSRQKQRPRSPEPRLIAKALFNFVGQSARELTFKKGDIIYIRRQIDKNWYEGDLNAMIGLFPANYVEIVPYDGMKSTPRKANEGQARAKYNFIAQSHLELSLAKGELVVITRRVDDNWFEGRIGGRKGIFPVSYVEVLVDAQEGQTPPMSTKPVASPAAHSMLLNGSAGGKESMGSHNYVPTFPTQDLGMSYRAKPVQITPAGTYGSLKKNPIDQALHIDIQNDPIAYKALYKYKPQNEDELELLEGDIVQVLEKCDDGWYVGTSERTGAFGTFPGNYVERITS